MKTREAHEVGRERELQGERVLAEILRDDGQRRRDDRPVEVLHEERARDDQRQREVGR